MTTDLIRVLVAGDYLLISRGLEMILSDFDDLVLVGEAKKGNEVLDLCAQTQVDVILMDLFIENDGCVTTISNIRKRYPNIQVILLANLNEYALIQQAISAGAAGILFKDMKKKDLATAIRQVHEEHHLLSLGLLGDYLHGIQPRPKKPQDLGNDLTDREIEVVTLISRGFTNIQIANEMLISRSTVKTHVSSIFSKLGVATRTEAAALAIRLQLVSVPMILDELTEKISALPEEFRERITADLNRLRNSVIIEHKLFNANQEKTKQLLRAKERSLKESNRLLKERDERFRILADSNPLLIWMTDAEGGNLFVNKPYREYIGITSEQVEGKYWQSYLHPEDAPGYLEAFQQSIREQKPFRGEAHMRRVDGELRLIATYAEPRFAENGTFLGHVGNSMDITERKQAEVELRANAETLHQSEQALRISESRFQASIESLLGGFAILKAVHSQNQGETPGKIVDFSFDYVNEIGCQMVSLTREQMLGHTLLELFSNRIEPGFLERLAAVTETDHPLADRMLIFEEADGKRGKLRLALDLRAVKNDDGLVLTGNDITEQVRAQQAIQENEQHFQVAVASMPMLVYTCDRDLRYTWVYHSLGEFHDGDLLGRRDDEIIPPEAAAALVAIKQAALESGQGGVNEVIIPRDGKPRYYLLVVEPIREHDGQVNGLTCSLIDITEQRQMELAHRKAITEMEIHYRLIEQREKERQGLALDIHDGPVQTLSGISFNLQTLKESFPDPALQVGLDQIGGTVKDIIEELRGIITELRPPSAIRFGLAKALEIHAKGLRERYPQIEWSFQLVDDQQLLPEPVCLALFRIYQESVNNVIRHSEATQAWINFYPTEDQAILEIRDNGKGLPGNYDKLTLTQENHFGLAGLEERVQAIGGDLAIASKSGQGTSVQVTVPILEKQGPQ